MDRNADIAHMARRARRVPGRLDIESWGLSGYLDKQLAAFCHAQNVEMPNSDSAV
jgi:hypothetical protein